MSSAFIATPVTGAPFESASDTTSGVPFAVQPVSDASTCQPSAALRRARAIVESYFTAFS